MPAPSPLDNLSIVLVRTKIAANIGAVSRCMMNTGLSRLVLVRPPDGWRDEAVSRASGATRPLDEARICGSLEEAVADQGLVIGTSRHAGRQRRNIRTARETASAVMPLLPANSVALVFGREVNGLTRQEIALCHELVQIPVSDGFPSLNLSHAVMVLAYELFLAAAVPGSGADAAPRTLAPAAELDGLFQQLERTLLDIGFLRENNRDHMLLSLRQIAGRARLDSRDAAILRGILTRITAALRDDRR